MGYSLRLGLFQTIWIAPYHLSLIRTYPLSPLKTQTNLWHTHTHTAHWGTLALRTRYSLGWSLVRYWELVAGNTPLQRPWRGTVPHTVSDTGYSPHQLLTMHPATARGSHLSTHKVGKIKSLNNVCSVDDWLNPRFVHQIHKKKASQWIMSEIWPSCVISVPNSHYNALFSTL